MLANFLLSTRKADKAISEYEKAIELDPEHALAHLNLGGAFAEQHRIAEAAECIEKACRIRPDKAAWKLRGASLIPAVFETTEEIDQFRNDLEERLDNLLESPPTVPVADLFETAFFPPFQLAYHGRNCKTIKHKFAQVLSKSIPKFDVPTPDNSRIRVGIVVTEQHEGIFLRTMRGILKHINRDEFEPVVLCSGGSEHRIRSAMDALDVEVVSFPHSLPKAFHTVAGAKCDILFYREICSDVVNFVLPQARLAPVQCTAMTTQITFWC